MSEDFKTPLNLVKRAALDLMDGYSDLEGVFEVECKLMDSSLRSRRFIIPYGPSNDYKAPPEENEVIYVNENASSAASLTFSQSIRDLGSRYMEC